MTPVRRLRKMPRWKRAVHRREALLELKRRTRFRVVLLIVGVVLACIAIMTLVARQSRGAVRVPLTWTAPARATTYECRVLRQDGQLTTTALTEDSLGLLPVVVVPAGEQQRAWALCSENWRAGTTVFLVRGCNAAGCGPWSNAVVVLAGIPDTLWMLSRDARAGFLPPIGGKVWQRAGGRVAFALQLADSLVPATILHQEAVQRAESARLCALFGHWALRGEVLVCP